MNIWENAVITQKGLSLLSKLIEGDMLNITKAETGEGYVTPGLLNQLTAVSNPKQALSFRTQSYPEEGKCKLPCYLTNAGLATGYTAKQVGVYATDPDDGEILFLIVQSPSDKGTVIPSETEMPGYSAEWNLYFQYGQASSVSVVVSPTSAVTREEMQNYVTANAAPAPFYAILTGSSTFGYAIDKTFAEITSAFNEGRDVRLLEYDSYMNLYKLARATASSAIFACNAEDRAYLVVVDKSGTVSKTSYRFLEKSHASDITAHGDIREIALNANTTANNAAGEARNAKEKVEIVESAIAYFQDKQHIVASSADGIAYTATIEGIDALFPGLEITIIPNKESTSEEVTLNINNLGARRIYPLFGPKTGEILGSVPENWISDSVPLKLIYEDLFWRAISPGRVNGANIYGSVPVEAGGTGRTGFSEGHYLKGGPDGIEEISTPDMASDVGVFLFDARNTDDVVAGETPLEYNHFIVVYE